MLLFGNNQIGSIYLGDNEVVSIYHGDELIYTASIPITNYVTFTAQQANSTIGLEKLSTNQKLWYSTNGKQWKKMATDTTITLTNSGDNCYIAGILNGDNTGSDHTQFKMTGKIAVSGNCNALWDYNNLAAPLKKYCGYYMFYNCTSLITAPELPATALASNCYQDMFFGCTSLTTSPGLPATTLASNCYYAMFYGCTSLTSAPELPATTLANYCYFYMFRNCTSLTTAPELPATILSDYCYQYMFYGCTSLTTAPELHATALTSNCYYAMFRDCTSLTTAPELPAITLANYCYNSMFRGCSRLNYIKCLAINGINQNNSTTNWVSGVASSGTFVKHTEAANWLTDSVDGIPTGWVVKDYLPVKFTAQEANSTIGLARKSSYQTLEYSRDLSNWSSMTTTTTITLANSGDTVYIRGILSSNNTTSNYTQFKMTGKIAADGNCNYLWNYENQDTPLKRYCGYYMFLNCTSLTTAPELPATTLAESCYNRMFDGCTSLTTAPELPATTLAYSCYYGMFSNTNLLPDCTNIDFSGDETFADGGLHGLFAGTKVNDNDLMNILPINQNSGHYCLPATTLTSYCYDGMFNGCTCLTTAPELPATELATGCYNNMFYNCTSLTTAPELPATTLAQYCYQGMFAGCTSLITAPELPATTLSYGCYQGMFDGCSSLTTAPELPATTLAYDCYASMFNRCTSLITAPELPATELATGCYSNMFRNCSNLETAPELHAATLTNQCYFCMFYDCTSLNYIKCLASNISATACTYEWVHGVASAGTFVKHLDATSWKTGGHGIPTNWTVEDAQ